VSYSPVSIRPASAGFTLIEVLIALAITAFVSVIAYTGLSTAIVGVESTRAVADRSYEINRVWMILSRDLRQFVTRPVRDEFGETEPALSGGIAARFPLSFTRGGWHNPQNQLRSHLQRVNYRVEDNTLWRDHYAVLDRSGDTQPSSVELLRDVEFLQLRFLPSLGQLQASGDGTAIETRDWSENWITDTSRPGAVLEPPVAVEVRLQLADWGELRWLYALPPL
tara:strand:- start:166986 stop:167657 length:672 start_codon:yes stop_codon:yes gene_type:complete